MRLAKLIGLIYERYGTVTAFAEMYDLNYAYLSRILNGKHNARKSTIAKLAIVLGLKPEEIGLYFFPECCADEQ